jgi:bisphosphoglycerate-dependent phosphoglycerate mutase
MTETTTQSGRSTFENFGRKVDAQFGKVGPRMEDEVKRVIAYLNDQVVPQVRQNSSSALRCAAEQLTRLAEHLDQRSRTDVDQRSKTGAQQAGDRPSAT